MNFRNDPNGEIELHSAYVTPFPDIDAYVISGESPHRICILLGDNMEHKTILATIIYGDLWIIKHNPETDLNYIVRSVVCDPIDPTFRSRMDGVETLVLSLFEEGVDLEDQKIKNAIQTAYDYLFNLYS